MEITIKNKDGVTLPVKEKYCEEDIVVRVDMPRFKGENSKGATFEIDTFLEGGFTEYRNDRVTKLGSAFCNNMDIKTVDFPNVVELVERTFSGAAYLENINLPKLKIVGSYGFHATKIKETNSVFSTIETLNGTNQFYSCNALVNLTMNLITSIASGCFASCNKLMSAYFPKVESIGPSAFSNCGILKAVVLPINKVVSLTNTSAFSSCYHILGIYHKTYNPESLKDGFIYVPDDLVEQYKVATN
jgi:hypothetical protein